MYQPNQSSYVLSDFVGLFISYKLRVNFHKILALGLWCKGGFEDFAFCLTL